MDGRVAQRVKRQHFVPRFYLANFCDEDGYLWTHDSRRGEAIRTTPENTGFETNIYSPEIEDGLRFDDIERTLSHIESDAAPLLKKLLKFEKLDGSEKAKMALFISSMFVRSPAQVRQFAVLAGNMASWMTATQAEYEAKKKQAKGESSEVEEIIIKYLGKKAALKMTVDRRVGLIGFAQLETISRLIEGMTWSFEISQEVELITNDNPVFWVPVEKMPASPRWFGLAHPNAVIPFPLSPSLILRIDHCTPESWRVYKLDKQKAKLANRMRAKHKEHCLYYRTHHDGIHRLGMKYATPVQQLNSSVEGPEVTVVRKLKD